MAPSRTLPVTPVATAIDGRKGEVGHRESAVFGNRIAGSGFPCALGGYRHPVRKEYGAGTNA
jgi:hypothetical protein